MKILKSKVEPTDLIESALAKQGMILISVDITGSYFMKYDVTERKTMSNTTEKNVLMKSREFSLVYWNIGLAGLQIIKSIFDYQGNFSTSFYLEMLIISTTFVLLNGIIVNLARKNRV